MYQKMVKSAISGKRGPLVLQTLYASVQGNARAKNWEWVGRGGGGIAWGTFGIALEIYLRKICNKKSYCKEAVPQLLRVFPYAIHSLEERENISIWWREHSSH